MSKQFHTIENMSLADAFKCLLENASDAIYVLDMHGNFLAVNRKAEELIGFEREYFIGKSFRKIISLKSLPKAINGFLDVIKGREIRLELELKTATKKTVLTEVTSRPLIINGKTVGTLGIVRDITKRVSMEKILEETNRKLETLLKTAMEGITIVDSNDNLTFVNKAFADILGYKEDELQGMNLRKFVDEEGFKKIRKQTETRKKGKISRYEIVLYRKDGKPRIVQVSASPLWNKDGTYAGALSIIMDVTERKNMEEKLRESEERLRLLIEYAPDAVYLNDLEGNFVDGNRQAEMLTGYRKEELIGKNFFEVGLFSERYLPKAMEVIEKNRHGEKFGPSEFELIRKDGNAVFVEISAFPVTRGGKVEVIGIARDITERKKMEEKLKEYAEHLEEKVEERTKELKQAQEQLLRSERLAAIGQVAAMVGHDLRNPLTGISSATYYLKTKLGSKIDKKTMEMLKLIENDIQHANKIIADLTEYSKEIRLELTETNPKSIVLEALSKVKIPHSIQVSNLAKTEPRVTIDVEKMKRVFVNIINNAIDAMPEGGKLTITTRESDGNVEIAIADTGTGITKEVLEKIWTPFFTTKAKGMGLGLPICKSIVEAHGGKISVESIVDKGITFTVAIPIEPKLEGGEKAWVNVPEFSLSTMTKA
jgi:two-component system sporulation sensor kinase A